MAATTGSIIGGTLVSGVLQKKAQDRAGSRAAGAIAEGSANEIEELRRQFDLTRSDLAPFREATSLALERLMSLVKDPSQVTKLPGFLFRRQQGQDVFEGSAAARGDLFSGNTLRGLEEFGQGFATNELGEEFNRLAKLAGLGAGGVEAGIQSGDRLSSLIGSSMGDVGRARAGAFLERGRTTSDLIGNLASNAIFAGRLNRLRPLSGIS